MKKLILSIITLLTITFAVSQDNSKVGIITKTTQAVATSFDGEQCYIARRIVRTVKNRYNEKVVFIIRTDKVNFEDINRNILDGNGDSIGNENVRILKVVEKMNMERAEKFPLTQYDALVNAIIGSMPTGLDRSEEDVWIEQAALLRITKQGLETGSIPYGTLATDWEKLDAIDWETIL